MLWGLFQHTEPQFMGVQLGKLPQNKHAHWSWNLLLLHGRENGLMECEVAEEEAEDSVQGTTMKRSPKGLLEGTSVMCILTQHPCLGILQTSTQIVLRSFQHLVAKRHRC
jgi:hypothetical protein